MKLFYFTILPYLIFSLKSKEVTENIVTIKGIPYARQPVGAYRFQESTPAVYSEDLPVTWKRCISHKIEEGRGEECLFFSIYRDKSVGKKTNTLVIITNEELDDTKISGIVTNKLNVIVASSREGVLAAFGGAPYGVSDVISLISFLQTNSDHLFIENITVWAEGFLAESVAAAIHAIEIKGVILINGNSISRTYEREKYAARATFKLRTETACDLPSFEQSVDCLRSKSVKELMEKSEVIVKSFFPFGNPYRSPPGYVSEKTVPTILGIFGNLPKDYPDQYDYNGNYSKQDFKKFLAALIPDSLHQNAPLLRRLILHQYIYSKGDKMDPYFLFQKSRDILLDRDFRVPIQKLIDHFVRFKNKLWVLEYSIDSTPHCLHPSTNEAYTGFCERLLQYFSRFATHGAPTAESCDPKNPTFPMMGASKRLYFVSLHKDGQPEWDHIYHKEACELWNNLLPSLDMLELTGRRDQQFEEEREVDPLLVEDDVQMWHEQAMEDKRTLTEEKVLNDMPQKLEL